MIRSFQHIPTKLFVSVISLAFALGFLLPHGKLSRKEGAEVDAMQEATEIIAQMPDREVLAKTYEAKIFPLLENYCYDCHMDGMTKGGVDLDAFASMEAVEENRDVWERLRRQLDLGLMPPPDKDQPGVKEMSDLLAWIDDAVFPVDPSRPDPGPTPWRRLNRTEYAHTIRDLFGIDFPAAEWLPPDDASGGFDTAASAQVLGEAQLRAYLRAAEQVLSEALVIGPPPRPYRDSNPAQWHGDGRNAGDYWLLFTNGGVRWNFDIKEPGRYRLSFTVASPSAGPDPARARLEVKDQVEQEVEIRTRRGETREVAIEWQAKAGPQEAVVSFLNDFFQKGEAGHPSVDRNLSIYQIKLTGPLDSPPPPKPESHQRIFGQRLAGESDRDWALRIFHRFARRAFRRPIHQQELEPYLHFLDQTSKRPHAMEEGVRLALMAMLVSPEFLVRGEVAGASAKEGLEPIAESTLASRLSYFLWSAPPDENLLEKIEAGTLRKNLQHELRRMLESPRAAAFTESFAGQWLGLRNLEFTRPDTKSYPQADPSLLQDLREETESLFEHIFFGNHPVTEFLTADYTFANQRLAELYQLDDQGQNWRRRQLPPERRGILTHGSILTLAAEPNRTSPVLRGKFVLEALLDRAPPPPPGNIPPLEASNSEGKKLSHREQLEMHRRRPDCAACHRLMDPIGLALENYDVTGIWRQQDGEHPIDPATVLANGHELSGPIDLLDWLAENEQENFVRCLVKKLLSYSLGRELQYYDQAAVDSIVEAARPGGFRSHDLILGVVNSVPFQMKRRIPRQLQASSEP